jgi:quercetin dioxygenase-like cupin family protein
MNKRFWLPITLAAAVGMAGGAALERGLGAQQSPISRRTVLTTDSPGGTTHELIMAVVDIAPGGASGNHRHHGVEVGYVLEGTLEVRRPGQPNETLTAGQPFKNDAIHNAVNPGTRPTKILAVFAVEKGKPLAEPVP